MPLASIVGGLIGFSMGLIGYGLATRVIERWLVAAERDDDEPIIMTRAELERWAIGFRRMVFAGTVLLFPLAGLLIGFAIGG